MCLKKMEEVHNPNAPKESLNDIIDSIIESIERVDQENDTFGAFLGLAVFVTIIHLFVIVVLIFSFISLSKYNLNIYVFLVFIASLITCLLVLHRIFCISLARNETRKRKITILKELCVHAISVKNNSETSELQKLVNKHEKRIIKLEQFNQNKSKKNIKETDNTDINQAEDGRGSKASS